MRLKLIACEVFYREVCLSVAISKNVVDVEFLEKNAHDNSDYLRNQLQQRIEATEDSSISYDAILLAYGLCGNSSNGLKVSRLPLVIPRAHDCCTLFLGSKTRFQEHFGDNPSLPFSSAGYIERGGPYLRESGESQEDALLQQYVKQYGEENARYIMESLHPQKTWDEDSRVVFIDVPETSHLGYEAVCRQQAEADGRSFVQLPGNIRLIRMLVEGSWSDEEFLVVNPGEKIVGVYDWEKILAATPE